MKKVVSEKGVREDMEGNLRVRGNMEGIGGRNRKAEVI